MDRQFSILLVRLRQTPERHAITSFDCGDFNIFMDSLLNYTIRNDDIVLVLKVSYDMYQHGLPINCLDSTLCSLESVLSDSESSWESPELIILDFIESLSGFPGVLEVTVLHVTWPKYPKTRLRGPESLRIV